MKSLKIVTTVLVLTCAAALPATGVAKSPPNGKYGCTLSGVGSFGTLKIVDNNSYKRNGKTGRYKAGDNKINFSDGFNGWKISFKTGSLEGFKGRWYKAESGTSEIALENPEDKGFESIYCDEE